MLMPRENLKLFGHQEACKAFLSSFHSPRFPYAWIISGPMGIGKATFAFHMARYILSGRQDKNTAFAETDPLHRRIMAKSHGDLWTCGDEEVHEIGIEPIRELNKLLNQTPIEGGWRAVIIDGAEKLNRNAANALLKRLEEPPSKTVFFFTTPLPGCLLPTIRSRCQLISLRPLMENDVKEVLSAQGFSSFELFPMAQGSPGRLIRLMEGDGVHIYKDFQKIIENQEKAFSFIKTYGGEEASYSLIEDLLMSYLHNNLLAKIKEEDSYFSTNSLQQALKLYEKIESLFNQCRYAQLDKQATLTCIFACLEKRN